jgi:hypothetical protein
MTANASIRDMISCGLASMWSSDEGQETIVTVISPKGGELSLSFVRENEIFTKDSRTGYRVAGGGFTVYCTYKGQRARIGVFGTFAPYFGGLLLDTADSTATAEALAAARFAIREVLVKGDTRCNVSFKLGKRFRI